MCRMKSVIVRQFLPRDANHKRGLYRHAVSVRLSVTFVYSVETNKHIFKIFITIGYPHHWSFPYQTLRRYSTGITGASNVGRVGNNRERFDCQVQYTQVRSSIVLLKLSTDEHKASRGLSASAELLVSACYVRRILHIYEEPHHAYLRPRQTIFMRHTHYNCNLYSPSKCYIEIRKN